jgi:PAS domain S-box-containing protein
MKGQRSAQLAAIVGASGDAIISIGADLVVRTWNAGAQRLFGYREAEAVGRSIVELIIPSTHEDERAAIYAAAESSRSAVLKETVRRHKDGRLLPVETNISPILDGAGNVTGFSIILRDISERRRAEDALQRHAELQALLLEITSDLIRAAGPNELSRLTFQRIGPALDADICTNFRLAPGGQQLKLEFGSGIPPEMSESVKSLELGETYCGTAAAIRRPVVADKERIACDPDAALVRTLGATAYACRPLLASDGRLLGTFAVASRTREGFTGDEIAWLGTVVNFLAQVWERLQAEQDLRASEERLRLALEAARLGSWQYDPLRRVFSADTRSQEIFDIAENEVAIEEIMKRVYADDAEKVGTSLAETLDPANPGRAVIEFRVQRGSGEIRWVETLALAYFEGVAGERRAVSVAGTVQDITERKEREDKERFLIREINHRAKNMLSVVYAIAQQTAAKNPEEFIERFSERIQALSANQDLLVRNEWKGVEIDDLVHTQLAHFVGLLGSRIAAGGPRLRLNAASAQAIGLALHELATNAGKYGALLTDSGHVDIRWETDGNAFAITWTEHDGPAFPPKQRGFGTIVMETMAERSLGGEVKLDYAPTGVTWRLTCPAANALETREQGSNREERKNLN